MVQVDAKKARKAFDEALGIMVSKFEKMPGTKIAGMTGAVTENAQPLTNGLSEAFKNLLEQNPDFLELPSSEMTKTEQMQAYEKIADCVICEKNNPSPQTPQASLAIYEEAHKALNNIAASAAESRIVSAFVSEDKIRDRMVAEAGPALAKALYEVRDELRGAIVAEAGLPATQAVQASTQAATEEPDAVSMEQDLGRLEPDNNPEVEGQKRTLI